MVKVHIIDKCPHCHGQAMLPVGEGKDYKGCINTRYAPCPICESSGNQLRWISLEEFAKLLQSALCQHEHTSAHGSLQRIAGEPWDDIVQACDDRGVTLG